jgi:hypothetical protein
VTQDADLLRESARVLRSGIAFAGVVYAPQMLVDIGRFVEDLTHSSRLPASRAIGPEDLLLAALIWQVRQCTFSVYNVVTKREPSKPPRTAGSSFL